MNIEELKRILHAPFHPSELEWRIVSSNKEKTSGLPYPYLTARAVHARLDEAFGPMGWSFEVRPTDPMDYREEAWEGGQVSMRLVKRRTWVGKLTVPVTSEDGFGVNCIREDVCEETDVEAGKGAVSGAIKRCAVQLGIGAYLYKLPEAWVPLITKNDPRWSETATYAGKNGTKTAVFFHPPQLPEWALPCSPMELLGNAMEKHAEAVRATPPPAPSPATRPSHPPGSSESTPWNPVPNGHIPPADLTCELETSKGHLVPIWFTMKHGQPGKKPIQGFMEDRALADLTWAELATDSLGGEAYRYLLWEINTFAMKNVDNDGRPLSPQVLNVRKESHESRISKAKAVILWILQQNADDSAIAREDRRLGKPDSFPAGPSQVTGGSHGPAGGGEDVPEELEDRLAHAYQERPF